MTETAGVVFVVDDDPLMRESLKNLIRSMGLRVEASRPRKSSCAVGVSIGPAAWSLTWMPGLSGLDLQKRMAEAEAEIPIIFITGHGDIPMNVQAMKAGAVEFLTKPFRDQALLDAIQQALERARAPARAAGERSKNCAADIIR